MISLKREKKVNCSNCSNLVDPTIPLSVVEDLFPSHSTCSCHSSLGLYHSFFRLLFLLLSNLITEDSQSLSPAATMSSSPPSTSRILTIAAAQLGPIDLSTPRPSVLSRLLSLLHAASAQGAHIVLFPECALTTFFPRYLLPPGDKPGELDSFFEHGDITDAAASPDTAPLFAAAKDLKVDICIGFAERTADGEGFNTAVYYSAAEGKLVAKYRKVHLPGTVEPFADPDAVNQLEKRYFAPGNLGFTAFRAPGLVDGALKKNDAAAAGLDADTEDSKAGKRETDGKGDPIVGMLICNDRRWPEAWRSYALQGAELILCGYNTAGYAPDLWGTASADKNKNDPDAETKAKAEETALFQHKLVMQANSYMNSCFSVCAAKAGVEDGKYDLIGGSCIVDPEGRILAEAKTKGDEIVVAKVNLADVRVGREKTFDFGRHRRVEAYGLITERTGVVEVELL